MSRILLIEDDRVCLELMAYLLRSQGHETLSAGTAESGTTMLECCCELDLIICDIGLGKISGIEWVRTLKKSGRFSAVPLIAVTAGDVGRAQEAFDAGFDRYFLKPIEPQGFLAEIEGCLPRSARIGLTAPVLPSRSAALPVNLSNKHQFTILAVDDKSANLDLVSALLQPLSYRIITARGVDEAIARAREEQPDLILTDVHMGDGTGFDLIHAIEKDAALQPIPWIVTSATHLEMDARAVALDLNDSNFILQPWEPETFVTKIHNRLRVGKGIGAAR
jgi:CheY-like chemotaxis protein